MRLTIAHRPPAAEKIVAEQDAILARRALDENASDQAKARLRAALEKRPTVRKAPPFSKRLAFAIAATFTIGLVLLGNAWRHRPAPLAFHVDGEAASAGAWVRAPADRSADLRFSDASDIAVDEGGRARVMDVNPNGARVVLEAGVAHVAITHRNGSKWHVVAGPFDVVVTGTEFDVAWDPASEKFSVHMKQGTVHVLGTLLGEGHTLTTGESLDVSLPEGIVHQSTMATAVASEKPEAPTAPSASTPDIVERAPDAGVTILDRPTPPSTSDHDTSRGERAPAWATLAKNGDYARAVENAESSGFSAACANGQVADVLALGDAARFSGHDDEARTAYAAVRSRSAGDDLAAEAAFDLGRLAFDREHQYAAAAKWFGVYGTERPNGPLAREAAGRLLEARQRAGDLAGAKDAAREYLALYPDGPRADLARSILAPTQSAP